MYSLRHTRDIELVYELHSRWFPEDDWVGNGHTFWVARDEVGTPVGFCSAILRPDTNCVFLSRAAVARDARGAGLQRRMVNARVAWAKKLRASKVITYVALKNYESIVNLLKCGFRFYTTAADDEDQENFHFLRLTL